MTTMEADDPAIADDDRLPWLESAEDDDRGTSSTMRLLTIIVIALLALAAAIFIYGLVRGHRTATGTGALIQAPSGDYKVKPDQPGGMKVEGEGDTVFKTSEGATTNGAVDTGALPETPIAGRAATKAAPSAGTSRVVTAVPPPGGALTAQAPAAALPAVRAGGGSALVQLGSFPTEAGANAAWGELSKRFGYLAALGKSVERAEVNGGTVFRLRVNAGSAGQATALCGKLKVAGEACFVPN